MSVIHASVDGQKGLLMAAFSWVFFLVFPLVVWCRLRDWNTTLFFCCLSYIFCAFLHLERDWLAQSFMVTGSKMPGIMLFSPRPVSMFFLSFHAILKANDYIITSFLWLATVIGTIHLGTAVVVLLENIPVMLSVEGAKAVSAALLFPLWLVLHRIC